MPYGNTVPSTLKSVFIMNIPLIIVVLYVIALFAISFYASKLASKVLNIIS